ncbi:hypothetical protein CK203_033444 [Vitis vinifera]|uniref:Retrotransposon gag domain-containing protein n=1 Tax=Vitis vinifera TaxID=29760 RepID=A0A438HMM4_VITVI|nr:hypothetical protein CK203_033444 [Vitis vinifera]
MLGEEKSTGKKKGEERKVGLSLEGLEARFGEVQDGLHWMELGMADKLRHLEETLNRLSDVLLANQEPPNHGNPNQEGHNGRRLVNTLEAQKVSLASYHLEGEANQWWQWIHRTFQEERRVLSWADFEDEL